MSTADLFNPETAPPAARATTPAARPLPAYLRTFWLLARSGMRERMHYKASFLVTSALRGVTSLADFVVIAVILLRFRFVAGWDMYEVAVLYGLASLSNAIFRTLGNELDQFENYMINGDFDAVLVRPWPTLLTVVARKMDLGRLGIGLQGIVVTAIGAANLAERGVLAGWELAYMLLALPLAGAAVLFAVAMATAAAGFWIIRTDELTVFTIYAPLTASFYPLSIYPGWLRRMLHTVIPVAFANYIPLTYLLGKGGGAWALAAAPLVAALALTVSYRIWTVGEGHYQSTGS